MSTDINSTQATTATNNTSSTTATTGTTTLGKDAFLKLLVAQLTHQDPTSPMDTGQFVSQMADFTSLEQTQNMSDAIDKLVSSQTENALSTEAALIGKKITWTKTTTDSNGNSSTSSVTDVVKAVNANDGSITYLTDSGEHVDPSTVTQIQVD
ncbi:flagellar hook capping FlgD N-terminal domain-containing protein [Sporolactobacillus spathodeae]|uniref:Flagellar basal-body rod modification protein FlgD n=1 Tax=Sporolactobacillus spathodeae TaxID=1465502 RepID=A0ABS2Q5R7_9BACL|nr:flagellar basal-body rod modification protein FlgD [Sporolactobacillus spathodeae]